MTTHYTFKHRVTFYLDIYAEDERDAVNKIRRAIEETSVDSADTFLKVDLTAGAFGGQIYLEPGEISAKNICKALDMDEVPF